MLVNEAVFILEQITERRLETSLEVSDKFKLNVFGCMILQCLLNNLEIFITKLYDLENTVTW